VRWREKNDIDTILKEEPAHYDLINRYVPFSMYLPDKEGHIVTIEKFGGIYSDGLKDHGIGVSELLRHYIFQLEWLWTVAAPREADMITMIMDLGNVTLDQLTSDNMELVKARVRIGCTHYPNRAVRLLVVNVPSWASYGYRIMASLISEETKAKIQLLTHEDLSRGALQMYIHHKNLRPEYGGTSKIPVGGAPLDLKILKQARRLARSGKPKGRSGRS